MVASLGSLGPSAFLLVLNLSWSSIFEVEKTSLSCLWTSKLLERPSCLFPWSYCYACPASWGALYKSYGFEDARSWALPSCHCFSPPPVFKIWLPVSCSCEFFVILYGLDGSHIMLLSFLPLASEFYCCNICCYIWFYFVYVGSKATNFDEATSDIDWLPTKDDYVFMLEPFGESYWGLKFYYY